MKVIPKKQRIKVYKRALEVIENEENVYELGKDRYLCLLLRCIDLNLRSYLNGIWDFNDTPKLYPEFKKYFLDDFNMRFERIFFNNRDLWRRVVLRLILEELKANEEY